MSIKTLVGLVGSSLVIACTADVQPTQVQLAALDNPPLAVQEKIQQLLAPALAWYEASEQGLLPQGRQLTAQEQNIAKKLGVQHPQNVRVIVLEQFPLPTEPNLKTQAEAYGFGSPYELGRTMGYAILLKPSAANDKTILAHELVHVQQIERMGRIKSAKRYLTELEILGYQHSLMEAEAYSKQAIKWD